MKIVVIVAIVVVLAVGAGAIALNIFPTGSVQTAAPSAPRPSQPAAPSQPQAGPAEVVRVEDISNAPSKFAGKFVAVEGTPKKDMGLSKQPYLLVAGPRSLSLLPKDDIDRYLGLKVKVSGTIRYNPQAAGLPSTALEIQSVQVLSGEPIFFLEIVKTSQDDKARPTLQRHLVYDNAGNLGAYEAGIVILQSSLSTQRLEAIKKALLETEVLALKTENYTLIQTIEDTSVYKVKFIVKVGNELKQNEVIWPSPAKVPPNVLKLQDVVNSILKKDSP